MGEVECAGGGCLRSGFVPLGVFLFNMCVETSTQSFILRPHNKSGRIFPLNQRINGGGGFKQAGWGFTHKLVL